MGLKKIIQTALLVSLVAAGGASADQFAVQTTEPVVAASDQLLEILRVHEVETVEIDGAKFIILDARDEGYVEAYIFAMNIDAKGLYRLNEDWNGAGLSSLPVEARQPFLHKTFCEGCSS